MTARRQTQGKGWKLLSAHETVFNQTQNPIKREQLDLERVAHSLWLIDYESKLLGASLFAYFQFMWLMDTGHFNKSNISSVT